MQLSKKMRISGEIESEKILLAVSVCFCSSEGCNEYFKQKKFPEE